MYSRRMTSHLQTPAGLTDHKVCMYLESRARWWHYQLIKPRNLGEVFTQSPRGWDQGARLRPWVPVE